MSIVSSRALASKTDNNEIGSDDFFPELSESRAKGPTRRNFLAGTAAAVATTAATVRTSPVKAGSFGAIKAGMALLGKYRVARDAAIHTDALSCAKPNDIELDREADLALRDYIDVQKQLIGLICSLHGRSIPRGASELWVPVAIQAANCIAVVLVGGDGGGPELAVLDLADAIKLG